MARGSTADGRGLSPTHVSLDNGVSVTVKQTLKTPAVALHLAVRAGSICDPVGGAGAMHLLTRVIDRGTTSRSADQIAEELDGRGISLGTIASHHLCSLACSCLTEDFESVLALVGDVLMQPSIPDVELTRRRHEVATAIRQDNDTPSVRAVEALRELLYGAVHPYGRRLKGTAESLGGLSRDVLLGLHGSRFAPSELSVVIVGDVEPPQAVHLANRVFGGWSVQPPPPVALEAVHPVAARRHAVIPMMNKAQADIAYGFTAVRRSDPSFYACWLMNNVLGQYAMGGRFGESIRERQGMAYYVSSALEATVLEGPLMVRAGVGAEHVDRAIASIDEELATVRRDGISEHELKESRQYLIGSMPRALETNAGIASFLQTVSFFGLGLDYDQRLPGLLSAVTLDEVNAAARRLLDPDRATVVVAGPYSGIMAA